MESNPYQSPGESLPTGYIPPPQSRPAAVMVFGILNLAFGALGLCGTVVSAGMLVFMAQNPQLHNPALEVMEQSPFYRVFNQVAVGLSFVAAIVLIVAGIGLLRSKAYGRKLSIGYSIYTIVSGIAGLIMSFIFIIRPLLEQANAVGGGPAKAGAIGGMIGGVIGGCVGLVYPIILWIFMSRRNVVEALKE